jgi:hypothetical protein
MTTLRPTAARPGAQRTGQHLQPRARSSQVTPDRHRARSRLAAVALGSGLARRRHDVGADAGHEPQEQSAALTIAPVAVPSSLPPSSDSSPTFPETALPASSAASPHLPPVSRASSSPHVVAARSLSSSANPAQSGDAIDPGARKKSPLRAETFAQVMLRLEPKIRECARKADLPESPTTVQIRSDPTHRRDRLRARASG